MSNTPDDLIWIQSAVGETGKSRDWIQENVQVYMQGRRQMVSRAAVMAALENYERPRPITTKKEGD